MLALWKSKRKVNIFPWPVFLGRFNPIDRVKKLSFLESFCTLCLEGGEDPPHLFFHCSLSKNLSEALFRGFGCFWVFDEKAEKE